LLPFLSRTGLFSQAHRSLRSLVSTVASMAPTAEVYAAAQASDASASATTVEVRVSGVRSDFQVPANLELIRGIGAGTYGMVAAFKDSESGKRLAVKKITNAFEDLIDGKRILREVRLLQRLDHENIVKILDMYPPDNPSFDDVYIVQELMEMDLTRVIRSKEPLSEEHNRWFAHQTLCGVLYLHSMDVVHRDLKPSNILVNRDCTIKICDFGLARGSMKSSTEDSGVGGSKLDTTSSKLTEYVVTRYYRAPEVVLLASEYGKPIDIWSVGCILCELIGRKTIFKGKDHLDQIRQILEITGAPSKEDASWLKVSEAASSYVAKFKHLPGRPWATVFPKATVACLDAVNCMLQFDPSKRPTALECLRHAFFSDLHKESDERVAEKTMDWSFDKFKPSKRLLQNYIYAECAKFHPSIVERDGQDNLTTRGITRRVLQGNYGTAAASNRRRSCKESL